MNNAKCENNNYYEITDDEFYYNEFQEIIDDWDWVMYCKIKEQNRGEDET